MKVTRGARLQAKLFKGLREGTVKLSIDVRAPDRSQGFHGLFERDRPKGRQIKLGPSHSLDNFFRETDELTFPNDIAFYRGVTIGAFSHIEHLLDDLGYRLAKTPEYKGMGRFFSTTEEKISHLESLCATAGPMAVYRVRARSLGALVRQYILFRNLMAHGEFSLHVNAAKQRLVAIRKFGRPRRQTFHDQSALLSIDHIARRAARLDRLARHANQLHYDLCKLLRLPSGLLEIAP